MPEYKVRNISNRIEHSMDNKLHKDGGPAVKLCSEKFMLAANENEKLLIKESDFQNPEKVVIHYNNKDYIQFIAKVTFETGKFKGRSFYLSKKVLEDNTTVIGMQ